MNSTESAPSLRNAARGLAASPTVVLAILGPAVAGSVIGSWLVFYGVGWEFPLWQILFTVFFYSRMALAWHRFSMIGEMPKLRGKPGPAGLRRIYLWRIASAVLMALFASVVLAELFLTPFFEGPLAWLLGESALTAKVEHGLFMWLAFSLICAFVLLIGPELPFRAAGIGDLDDKPMKSAFITLGSLFFSPIGMLNPNKPRDLTELLSALGLKDGSGNPIPPVQIARIAAILGLCGAVVWTGLSAVLALLGMLPGIGAALSGEAAQIILSQSLYGFGALLMASLLAQHARSGTLEGAPSEKQIARKPDLDDRFDPGMLDIIADRPEPPRPAPAEAAPLAAPLANPSRAQTTTTTPAPALPLPGRGVATAARPETSCEESDLRAIFRSQPTPVAPGPEKQPTGLLQRLVGR